MNKSINQINGWFSNEDCKAYDFLLSTIKNGGVFVECGAWMGKSSSYLCDHANNNVSIYIVDTWMGSTSELHSNHKAATKTDIYKIFLENMGDRQFIPIRKTSKIASLDFLDESCDVVFIDMEHTYDAVLEDIQTWLPKVKFGGYIAGHDYIARWPGVKRAVNEKFNRDKILTIGDCWIIKKE